MRSVLQRDCTHWMNQRHDLSESAEIYHQLYWMAYYIPNVFPEAVGTALKVRLNGVMQLAFVSFISEKLKFFFFFSKLLMFFSIAYISNLTLCTWRHESSAWWDRWALTASLSPAVYARKKHSCVCFMLLTAYFCQQSVGHRNHGAVFIYIRFLGGGESCTPLNFFTFTT